MDHHVSFEQGGRCPQCVCQVQASLTGNSLRTGDIQKAFADKYSSHLAVISGLILIQPLSFELPITILSQRREKE